MSLAVRDRVALVTGGTDGIGMKRLVPLLIDPWLAQTPTEAAAAGLRLLLGDEFEGVTGALFLKIRKFRALAHPRPADWSAPVGAQRASRRRRISRRRGDRFADKDMRRQIADKTRPAPQRRRSVPFPR
jgi:hypothetical protein